jgi:hypothetical protein
MEDRKPPGNLGSTLPDGGVSEGPRILMEKGDEQQ